MEINLLDAGNRIKKIREKHGYTMADLGNLVGANSPSTINNSEKGNNLPNKKRLEKIALLGGTSIEWIKYGGFSDYVYRLTQSIEEKILRKYGETTLYNYRETLLDELMIEKVTYEEDTKILSIAEKIYLTLFQSGNNSEYFLSEESKNKLVTNRKIGKIINLQEVEILRKENLEMKEKIESYEKIFDNIEVLIASQRDIEI